MFLHTPDFIAEVCHEVNRAYCAALGDTSQVPWDEAPEWQKISAKEGVAFHAANDVSPEESHKSWLRGKEADGWCYGPVKDVAAKTHPCFVPFDELPTDQKAKDFIFKAIVDTLIGTK
jgi:hypothetical protein